MYSFTFQWLCIYPIIINKCFPKMHTLRKFDDELAIQMNHYSIFVNAWNTLFILNLCAYNTHNVILVIQIVGLFFSFNRNKLASFYYIHKIYYYSSKNLKVHPSSLFNFYCIYNPVSILTHLRILDTIWKLLQTQNEGNSILQILETKQKWLNGVTNHEYLWWCFFL